MRKSSISRHLFHQSKASHLLGCLVLLLTLSLSLLFSLSQVCATPTSSVTAARSMASWGCAGSVRCALTTTCALSVTWTTSTTWATPLNAMRPPTPNREYHGQPPHLFSRIPNFPHHLVQHIQYYTDIAKTLYGRTVLKQICLVMPRRILLANGTVIPYMAPIPSYLRLLHISLHSYSFLKWVKAFESLDIAKDIRAK